MSKRVADLLVETLQGSRAWRHATGIVGDTLEPDRPTPSIAARSIGFMSGTRRLVPSRRPPEASLTGRLTACAGKPVAPGSLHFHQRPL